MQVIGLSKLHALAEERPDLAPVLGALAARLMHLAVQDAPSLAASLGAQAESDEVDLCFARSGVRLTMRCDEAAGVVLIVTATATGVS